MTLFARFRSFPSAVMGALTLCLMLLMTACGSSGSNEEEDDSQFPEPPGRPSAVQVDSVTASSTISSTGSAVPVYATTPAVVDAPRR
jgi:hypothetical protein